VAFTEKLLRFTFQLGSGTFNGTNANVMTLEGLRATAQIILNTSTANIPGGVSAIAVLFGMTLGQINQLSVAGQIYRDASVGKNYMLIEANDGTGYTTAFSGKIMEAVPQFAQQPQVAFVVSATATREMSLKPVAPNTFKGATDVAQIMQSLAQTAGLKLENNGVDVKLSNPYFWGDIITQIVTCAKAANINSHIDPVAKVLAIWPKNATRAGDPIMISPSNESINYPEFQNIQVRIRTLFNPALQIGKQMRIQSQLTAANGLFEIIQAEHSLSSKMPDGFWHTECIGTPLPIVTASVT
jgi:hypothetical protein